MSKKADTHSGQRIYTRAEYEHYCFAQIPFSGYVEGIGYTCTQVEITALAINPSHTEFMYRLDLIDYTFDMGEVQQNGSQDEDTTPDRSNYWQIPTFDKAHYHDDEWKYLANPLAFTNNVLANIFNSVIDLVNGPIGSTQIMYHEGMDSWWLNEKEAAKRMLKAPIEATRRIYEYHTETPVRTQLSDFQNDISNIENWEESTAFGLTLFAGGLGATTKAGTVGKLGEPSITLIRGINTDAGIAYQRGLKGVVKPRGGIFGHSNPYLHNAGQTANSRLTSWTTNGDVAINYALRKSNEGVILRVTIPVSRLIKSPSIKDVLLKHKKIKVNESEVLLKGIIRKNIEVARVELPK